MSVPVPTPQQLIAENQEIAKKLKLTLGAGNELLNRVKAVARAAEERVKKMLHEIEQEQSAGAKPGS